MADVQDSPQARVGNSLKKRKLSVQDIKSASDHESPSDLDSISDRKPKFPYAELPPEIRNKICEYALFQPRKYLVLDIETDKATSESCTLPLEISPWNIPYPAPKLLAALRCKKGLYSEALVIWYKINTFHLSANTAYSFLSLKPQALELIQKVSVSVQIETSLDRSEESRGPEFCVYRNLITSANSRLYQKLKNLKHIEMTFWKPECAQLSRFIERAPKWDMLQSAVVKFAGLDKYATGTLMTMRVDSRKRRKIAYSKERGSLKNGHLATLFEGVGGAEWQMTSSTFEHNQWIFEQTLKRKATAAPSWNGYTNGYGRHGVLAGE